MYPRWFLKQGEVSCEKAAVGYANLSFYTDSSAARAFRNGCETFVKQMQTYLTGGQAFWSTEVGTFWMGSNFQEQFDTIAVANLANHLKALDTLFTDRMVAILLADSACFLEKSLRERQSLQNLTAPIWTEIPPQASEHYYAVGMAPEYFYEASSRTEAERLARRNLARSVFIDVKALQKVGKEGQEIRHEELSVTLRNVQILARWKDLNKKIFYVLVRMPKY